MSQQDPRKQLRTRLEVMTFLGLVDEPPGRMVSLDFWLYAMTSSRLLLPQYSGNLIRLGKHAKSWEHVRELLHAARVVLESEGVSFANPLTYWRASRVLDELNP